MEIEWRTADRLVGYVDAVAEMEARVAGIHAGREPELVWLVEHPALYTAGTSAADDELIDPHRFPVYKTGRGGRYTYHGPGQRVAYVMLDLKKHGNDIRGYVRNLEAWVIACLAELGVTGERRDGRVGIWVAREDGRGNMVEEKIAAIGVRIRRWISFHGIAINVAPDLSHFSGIVPCGIAEHGVTSLHALGITVEMSEVDEILKKTFAHIF